MGRGDGKLLLIELSADDLQCRVALDGQLGGKLSQQTDIQAVVAQVADDLAGRRIDGQVILRDHAGVDQHVLRPRLIGGAALHADAQAGEVGRRVDGPGEARRGQRDAVADVVEIGEIDHLLAVGRDGDRADGGIHAAKTHGVDQPIEGEIVELDRNAQLLADRARQRNVEAIQLKVAVVELEGWIVGRGAKNECTRGLDARPVRRRVGWRLLHQARIAGRQ